MWLLMTTVALAHKPTFSDGGYASQDDAYEVQDPEVSIVVYHEVTCDSPELWMTLETSTESPTYLQLGIPVIDRLADYRPSVAMFAPGLPELDPELVPFEVPQGMGGVVFDTADVDEPGSFYEPFTDTSSWVIVETYVEVTQDGVGYIVAWDPGEMSGKLWVATGETEQFTSDDWSQFSIWLDRVQAFHESGSGEVVTETVEEDCSEEVSSSADKAKSSKAQTRCSTTPDDGPPLWSWLVIAGCAVLRRRRSDTCS